MRINHNNNLYEVDLTAIGEIKISLRQGANICRPLRPLQVEKLLAMLHIPLLALVSI